MLWHDLSCQSVTVYWRIPLVYGGRLESGVNPLTGTKQGCTLQLDIGLAEYWTGAQILNPSHINMSANFDFKPLMKIDSFFVDENDKLIGFTIVPSEFFMPVRPCPFRGHKFAYSSAPSNWFLLYELSGAYSLVVSVSCLKWVQFCG